MRGKIEEAGRLRPAKDGVARSYFFSREKVSKRALSSRLKPLLFLDFCPALGGHGRPGPKPSQAAHG